MSSLRTLDEVLSTTSRADSQKWDAYVPWKDITLRAGKKGVRLILGQDRSLALERHAFAQICTRLGVPAYYASTLAPAMAVKLLAYERRRWDVDREDRPLLLRGRGNAVRGVLSTAYVPLDDEMAVSALQEATVAGGCLCQLAQTPGPGGRSPAPAAAPLPGHQHPRRELQAQGQAQGGLHEPIQGEACRWGGEFLTGDFRESHAAVCGEFTAGVDYVNPHMIFEREAARPSAGGSLAWFRSP